MTYGWAILAAIIAIGVLAYFGVFNPSRLAGSAGVLNAPMNVDEFNILADDSSCSGGTDCMNLIITQNSGQALNVTSTNITLTSGGSGSCSDTILLPSAWSSGSKQTFLFECGNSFENGASIAGNIEIKYTVTGSDLVQTSTGNIRGVAQ